MNQVQLRKPDFGNCSDGIGQGICVGSNATAVAFWTHPATSLLRNRCRDRSLDGVFRTCVGASMRNTTTMGIHCGKMRWSRCCLVSCRLTQHRDGLGRRHPFPTSHPEVADAPIKTNARGPALRIKASVRPSLLPFQSCETCLATNYLQSLCRWYCSTSPSPTCTPRFRPNLLVPFYKDC
jgi:hypothetical protein